jgi:hypothetical protein
MSIRWTEHDPYTGVTTINDASEDDWIIRSHRIQDVQPLLDRVAETRNTRSADRPGKDLHIYCTIPVVEQYELLKKGLNVFNPAHMPKILEEINANYPKLKYTNKTHSLTPKRTATSLSKPHDSQTQESSEKPGPFVIVR